MTLKALSLFTGIGGLDFGFEAAGYQTCVALDNDPDACKGIRRNRKWPLIQRPISAVSSEDILNAARLRVGEADILIGGPPCQPFSKSGYWANGDARRLDDPRADTLSQYLRVLRDTQPRTYLLENVPGLAFRGKTEGIEALKAGIAQINLETGHNYSLAFKSLNAANFGVPQMRERVFVIGSRDGKEFKFPEPTHTEDDRTREENPDHEPFLTCWDAFAGLSPPSNSEELEMRGKWADLLPSIPEGKNYLYHTERGEGVPLFGWRRRYWNFLLKLAKDRPSWTLQAQPGPATGPFHWDNRRLSAAELCRLQTFPDGLIFDGSISTVQKLVGNAVASGLAEVLAREIAFEFLQSKKYINRLKLIPTRNSVRPFGSRPMPVAKKYMHLIGSDTAHPGTGQGRAAQNRSTSAA